MKKLAIIGAGDLGQLIAHHAAACGYGVYGFYDDFNAVNSDNRVMGKTSDAKQGYDDGLFSHLMMGIGYKHFEVRKRMFQSFQAQEIPFAVLVHPSCMVEETATVGEGSFLLPGCTLDHNVVVGDNVLLNTGCVVSHDTAISSHSFLGPGVVLAGFIKIGQCCMIGVNSTVIDNVSITDEVRTGGGTVVTKSLTESGLYVGAPARKLDERS
ncbi:MAG TPA: hypothetical protein DCR04_07220 [Flavobacteriales bacterium]|nr:hypothetical protein [Flavobacteriales bacterium]